MVTCPSGHALTAHLGHSPGLLSPGFSDLSHRRCHALTSSELKASELSHLSRPLGSGSGRPSWASRASFLLLGSGASWGLRGVTGCRDAVFQAAESRYKCCVERALSEAALLSGGQDEVRQIHFTVQSTYFEIE